MNKLQAPDLALMVAKRRLELCDSGAKPDVGPKLRRMIWGLERQVRNGAPQTASGAGVIRALVRLRPVQFVVDQVRSAWRTP
ncbi:MAG: hypothetical protein AAFV19_21050 [Pseudomonadota bacterium]